MNKHVLRCKNKPLKPDPEKDLLKDQVNTLQLQLQRAHSEWYDRLQTSADDGTSMFIDQMHRVHESLKSLGNQNAEI